MADDPRAAAVFARLPAGMPEEDGERLLMLALATNFSVGKANRLIAAAWLDDDPEYVFQAERWLRDVGLGSDPALLENLEWARRRTSTRRPSRGRPRATVRDLELLALAGTFADYGLVKLREGQRYVDRRVTDKLFDELQAELAAGMPKNEAVASYLGKLGALPIVGPRRAPRFDNSGTVERVPKQARFELAKRFKMSPDALERTLRRVRARWRLRASVQNAASTPD